MTTTVTAEEQGQRLDRFLRLRLPHAPLSLIFRLIRTGGARVDGRRVPGSHRLAAGDQVETQIDAGEAAGDSRSRVDPSRIVDSVFFQRSFRVVFEDEAVLACDKPPGLVVHPGSGHTRGDSLVELADAYLARRGGGRAWLVHRIDRDTSGLILLAKGRQALLPLTEALRRGGMRKTYALVCHGRPAQSHGRLETRLVRTYGRNTGAKMVVADEGQEARSTYRVVRTRGGVSMLDVTLETGRTHQIRVQMAHLGCPIAGDVRYGNAELDERLFRDRTLERRLYLHARALAFPHPLTGETIALDVPPPESFARVLDAPR